MVCHVRSLVYGSPTPAFFSTIALIDQSKKTIILAAITAMAASNNYTSMLSCLLAFGPL
jgi:hypothetical protein